MAISHVQPLLLLLASLFFLPGLRAIPVVDYNDCTEVSARVAITSVDVFRDHDYTSFNISASTDWPITRGELVMVSRPEIYSFLLPYRPTNGFTVHIIATREYQELICLTFKFHLHGSASMASVE
ncbi:hypothetical protein AALP_AA8G002000 [Arabis alpina]|uniref:MD-2-related lipid-recognition domain-containing protein n=1 Tax=Arabis alpina TaxID=50452 RepID=A0A087G412_ARAAL|nr:hypothetical protein AALP_AA8G002000 [Arabis alpina]